MRAVAGPGRGSSGRWIWGLSGLITAAAIAVPGALLIASPGDPANVYVQPQHVVTRTETVPQPVTSLVVQSYGGQVQVTSGQVNRVQITETIAYDQQARPPAVMQSVSGGRLALSEPCVRQRGLLRQLQDDRAAAASPSRCRPEAARWPSPEPPGRSWPPAAARCGPR